VVLAAIRAVHRMCSHILDSGDLTPSTYPTTDAENAGLSNSDDYVEFNSDTLAVSVDAK